MRLIGLASNGSPKLAEPDRDLSPALEGLSAVL
jgi:hypothetical protein